MNTDLKMPLRGLAKDFWQRERCCQTPRCRLAGMAVHRGFAHRGHDELPVGVVLELRIGAGPFICGCATALERMHSRRGSRRTGPASLLVPHECRDGLLLLGRRCSGRTVHP
jgi:hypothetical protein